MSQAKSVESMLDQQLGLLSKLQELLVQEQSILVSKKLEQLADIPPQKTKLLLQLQAGDNFLSGADLTSVELQPKVEQAKSRLALCKRINEENGRMISLAMTSIGKIHSLMAKAGHHTATTTYTAEGKTNSLLSSGNSISV